MKYATVKDHDWQTYHARSHTPDGRPTPPVDPADLRTSDGTPLPKAVVDHFVAVGALKPIDELSSNSN